METYDKLTVANKTIEWLSEELENVNSSYVLLQIEGASNNILIEALEEELKKQKSIISSMVTAKPSIDNTGIHYAPQVTPIAVPLPHVTYPGGFTYPTTIPNPNYQKYVATCDANIAALTGKLTTSTTESPKSPAIPFCDTYNGTSRPNLNY